LDYRNQAISTAVEFFDPFPVGETLGAVLLLGNLMVQLFTPKINPPLASQKLGKPIEVGNTMIKNSGNDVSRIERTFAFDQLPS